MCTAAVSRTSALSIGIAHPPTHRPSSHATRRCWRQVRTGARRLDPTIRDLAVLTAMAASSMIAQEPPRTALRRMEVVALPTASEAESMIAHEPPRTALRRSEVGAMLTASEAASMIAHES